MVDHNPAAGLYGLFRVEISASGWVRAVLPVVPGVYRSLRPRYVDAGDHFCMRLSLRVVRGAHSHRQVAQQPVAMYDPSDPPTRCRRCRLLST